MSELKTTAPRHAANRPARERRWLRWIATAGAAIVVLVVLAAWAFVKFGPTAPPLALPAGPASSPAGALDGSWTVAGGSVAGFRVRETALGLSNDAVGRSRCRRVPADPAPAVTANGPKVLFSQA